MTLALFYPGIVVVIYTWTYNLVKTQGLTQVLAEFRKALGSDLQILSPQAEQVFSSVKYLYIFISITALMPGKNLKFYYFII